MFNSETLSGYFGLGTILGIWTDVWEWNYNSVGEGEQERR